MTRIYLLSYLFVFVACTNDPVDVKNFIANEVQAVEQIKGAELVHTENGRLKLKIICGKIERVSKRQPSVIFSEYLAVYFYNDSLEVQSILKSERASFNEETQIMLAEKNVELSGVDNKKLETEELIWDEANDKIYTDKEVKITTGKEIIYGQGFVSNSEFTKYSILNIHGTFDLDVATN